jgi:hypothetical protein
MTIELRGAEGFEAWTGLSRQVTRDPIRLFDQHRAGVAFADKGIVELRRVTICQP